LKNFCKQNPRWWIFLILGAGLLFLLGVVNYRFVKENPGGNDFLVHWMGTRMLITKGISPYSEETAIAIQTMAYGRPAMAGEHELRVAYPLYSMVIFLPFALFPDYVLARALWMTTLEIGLVLLAVICMQLAEWKPKSITLAFYLIFGIFWYHSLRALINGNAVILVTLLIAGSMLAIKYREDKLAGVLLALSTIKPQVAVLVVVFLIYWAMRQKRWQFIGWFLGSLGFLCVFAGLLIPNWMWQNLLEIFRYPGYNPPGTPVTALAELIPNVGSRIGWVISGSAILILLVEWYFGARRHDFPSLLWVFCLTLALGQWSGIQTDPGNFLVAFPALPLIFNQFEKRWKVSGFWITVICMVVLFVGIWLIFFQTVTYGDHPQQSPAMFFPLPAILTLMLYGICGWRLKRPGLWVDRTLEK
jgi:hypothetical protein